MSNVVHREVIAQLVIILAVSLGGWLVFVHPKAKKLEDVNRVLFAASSAGDPLGEKTIAQLASQMSEGRERLQSLEHLNLLADNTTVLYGLFNQLGATHQVTVRSISPGTEAKPSEDGSYTAIRIDMTLLGRYENVADFIDAVGDLPGHVRPVTLTLTPENDGPDHMTLANFSCEVLRFEMPEVLKRIGLVTP